MDYIDEKLNNIKTLYTKIKKTKNSNKYNNEMLENLLRVEAENEIIKSSIILKNKCLKSSNKIILVTPTIKPPLIYGKASTVFKIVKKENTGYKKWKTKFNEMTEMPNSLEVITKLRSLGYICAFEEIAYPNNIAYWFK